MNCNGISQKLGNCNGMDKKTQGSKGRPRAHMGRGGLGPGAGRGHAARPPQVAPTVPPAACNRRPRPHALHSQPGPAPHATASPPPHRRVRVSPHVTAGEEAGRKRGEPARTGHGHGSDPPCSLLRFRFHHHPPDRPHGRKAGSNAAPRRQSRAFKPEGGVNKDLKGLFSCLS